MKIQTKDEVPSELMAERVRVLASAWIYWRRADPRTVEPRFTRDDTSPSSALESALAAQTMRTSTLSIPTWAILPVVLIIETALCAVLAAATLDSFVRRPQQGGGSITTLLPGFVYASATVMKVCMVSALVSVVVGLGWRLFARGPSKRSSPGLPVWGIASIALTPSTPFLGALAVLVTQRLVSAPGVMSAGNFSQVARSAVFVMLVIILAGVLAAVTSLIRRERPSMLPILGLVANMLLLGLFWHFRFYALGFDQDMWAPR